MASGSGSGSELGSETGSTGQAAHSAACVVPDTTRDHARLIAQLRAYYRELGWWVETVDDDAADLCLRRDRDVVLLRAVAEADGAFDASTMRRLVDALASRQADGGIAIACAGFSADAPSVASSAVKCLDAAAVHGMLGELPKTPAHGDPFAESPPPGARASARTGMRTHGWALAIACALAACAAYAGLRMLHAG